jgi:hypothetical protein
MSPLRSTVVACTLGAAALTGCITGDRPTLAEQAAEGAPTGEPAIDAVLSRLEGVDDAAFTAGYEITNHTGPVTRAATVTQASDGRQSITIGDIRFLTGTSDAGTCEMQAGTCSETVDDGRVSDLQVTHQFWGQSTARRLRTDAGRNVGTPTESTAEIAGQAATCVTVPVQGGSKVYCALDSGALARFQGPDVSIELTSYAATPDESLFTRPG